MGRISEEMQEVRTKYFWIAVLTEYIGTTFFIYLLTSVIVGLDPSLTNVSGILGISFGIGLAISTLAYIFGPISGGHFNPAVTSGLITNGDCGMIRGVCYVVAQYIGAITGAGITYGLTPSLRRGELGVLKLQTEVTTAQGFFVELLLTMVLVFTVLGSTSKDHGRKDFGYANALAIGISVTVCHLIGVPYTGSGINPARAFGPAAIMNDFGGPHWIYWVAPYTGGTIAALLYRFIFSKEKETYDISASNQRMNNISVTVQ